jgi:hypothetical protein
VGKRLLGIPKRRWEDNSKTDLTEIVVFEVLMAVSTKMAIFWVCTRLHGATTQKTAIFVRRLVVRMEGRWNCFRIVSNGELCYKRVEHSGSHTKVLNKQLFLYNYTCKIATIAIFCSKPPANTPNITTERLIVNHQLIPQYHHNKAQY